MFPGPYFGKTYFPAQYFPQGAGSGDLGLPTVCSDLGDRRALVDLPSRLAMSDVSDRRALVLLGDR